MARGLLSLFLLAGLVLAAGPVAAETPAAEADSTAAEVANPLPVELDDEYFERLDDLKCTDLNGFAYREVPRFVLSDRPDLLYELVLYWESRCLTTEPVFRIIVLGSIWDAEFDEGLYEEEVIDRLIERYDPPVKSRHPEPRKEFDDFTVTFADQLLPHVPRGSVEEFFCLYYSGKTEDAWELLASAELEDTWLRFYYDEELAALSGSRNALFLELTGGGWWPRGNVEFVGDKPLAGIMGTSRWTNWLARVVLEMRIGRSDEPYWVDHNGFVGRSNRFNAWYLGGEFGRIAWKRDAHHLDLFVGGGVDWVWPFKDEEIGLAAFNGNAGLGYRFFLGRDRRISLGLDVRREWIGKRNENTDSMSGGAWSLRFSVGYSDNNGNPRRLKGLGQP